MGGLAHPEKIEEMDRELTSVIEDFDRAVNVEALRLAKEIGMHSSSQSSDISFSLVLPVEQVQQDLWLRRRLRPAETSYSRNLRCMDGTREAILDQILAWATDKSKKDVLQSNIFWIYGLPGIGKTSLAHSICARLHKQKRLAGAFFCQRDDPNLSEPRNILPTLIYKLAEIFSPFRIIVSERLCNDTILTAESMPDTLFLDFIRSLHRDPEHTLVFVIDALDECGNSRSRPSILKVLNDVAAQAPWLRVIITSRPEVDIQRVIDTPTRYDLAKDEDASRDLRIFARQHFDLVASEWHLSTPWPEELLFSKVISRAHGLFIFIKTLVLVLQTCNDPEEALRVALQGPAGTTGTESLYTLYSNILTTRIVPSNSVGFWQVIAVITTAQYSPLSEDPIAKLAGVKSNIVKKWVDDLSSLLYRDEGADGGIRVRHLSISDFFAGDDYRAQLQDANVHLSIACLKTMLGQLRFNICHLEDSRLANADLKDLPFRVKENISGPLQYSSLYWPNHLCFAPDNGNRNIRACLTEFFEGLYPLLWIEVLSVMGMVSIGAPSLRRVTSWFMVSRGLVLISIRC
jgi:hypothetical protein